VHAIFGNLLDVEILTLSRRLKMLLRDASLESNGHLSDSPGLKHLK